MWSAGLFKAGISIAAAAVTLVTLEIVACTVATYLLHHPRLLQYDATLGWKPMPNLSAQRVNADGDYWTIKTNSQGFRTRRVVWPENDSRRVVILGDSFAFGEGVDEPDRFDTEMLARQPEWAVMDLGVMGFGTDQQTLAGRPYLTTLRSGDVVLLLFCGNDVFDVLRHEFAGRTKPWLDIGPESLVWHSPSGSWRYSLSDWSYLVARFLAMRERKASQYTVDDLRTGLKLIKLLVQSELLPLERRGIQVVIAHHQAETVINSGFPESEYTRFWRDLGNGGQAVIVALDPFLSDESVFLADGHWSPKGHWIVARALDKVLSGPLRPTGPSPTGWRAVPGREYAMASGR